MAAETQNPDVREALFRRIDERHDEVAELTASLIRIPTVNPPGDATLGLFC